MRNDTTFYLLSNTRCGYLNIFDKMIFIVRSYDRHTYPRRYGVAYILIQIDL